MVAQDSKTEATFRLIHNANNDVDLHAGKLLQFPKWFDEEKFKRGQKFFRDNYFAMFVSKLCGLLVVLCVPNILDVLIMTNKSSSPKTAFKRYFSTLSHMLLWYNGDVTDNMSRAYKSLSEVNAIHTAANRRGRKEGVGAVSQASLALTQFGFMGFVLTVPEKLGIYMVSEDDLDGFVHFWRTIGHLVGLEDRYNICRETVAETRDLCNRIMADMYKPRLEFPSQDFLSMAKFLLLGMWVMVPSIDVEAFMAFTGYLTGLEAPKFTNWYSRMTYNIQVYIHKNMLGSRVWGALWRTYFNSQMWLTVLITSKFPFLAYYAFGRHL